MRSATEVSGVASFSVLNDSVSCEAVATALALPKLRYVLDFQQGGQSPSIITYQAATAVATGQAEAVLVFRALNGRSGIRVGSGAFAGGAAQFRYPIGYNAYLMYIAMWARRYMYEVGATEADLAAVAIAQRPRDADFHSVLRPHHVETIHSREASLDEVFVDVTGRSLAWPLWSPGLEPGAGRGQVAEVPRLRTKSSLPELRKTQRTQKKTPA